MDSPRRDPYLEARATFGERLMLRIFPVNFLLEDRERKVRRVRLYRVLIWVALLVAVLGTGCGQDSPQEQGTQTKESSSTAPEGRTQQERTSEETSRIPTRGEETTGGETTSRAGEGREVPFTAAPEMSGGTERAAGSILEVRFGEHEGYERVVIVFGSEGTTASGVPAWSLSSPTGEGYARITFPGVETTSISDGAFNGSILDNFYVVRAPGGDLFVDIFATEAFQYRVIELSDPGRLVVDYRSADVALGFPIPTQAQKTVLFEPRRDEAITSPLRVSGYSRNPEASNTIALRDPSGNVLSQSTVLSNDWLDTWGYFETSLEFPTFEGIASLQVGSNSPRDGSFEGVVVPVTYGGE